MGNDKKYYKKIKKGMRKGSGATRSKAAGIMKLSTDPQSVISRKRRHRIRERLNILQSMVPGTNKMDTVSMLEEAIQYVKFLKNQILLHQATMSYIYDPIIISPFSSFPSSISCSSSSSLLHSSVDIPIRMPSPQPISWPSYSFKGDDSCLMLQVYNHEHSS